MTRSRRGWRSRSKVERLRERGDVSRLVRLLGKRDWLVDRDGVAVDLEVGRRIEVVTALGTIEDPSAEEGVVRALEDPDPRVRVAAVEALRPSPSPRAAKALARATALWREPALDDARKAALDLLVELADELNAVEYVQLRVESRDGYLTETEEVAIRRLFAADSGPVAEILADELAIRLSAGDTSERRLAEQALVAMGHVSIGPLVSALDDPGRRLAAAAALGALRDRRAVPTLVDMLAHEDPAARAAAARALGEIRDPAALQPLVRASGDPHIDVRGAALEALDAMRSVVAMFGAAALIAENGTRQPTVPRNEQEREAWSSLLHRLLGR